MTPIGGVWGYEIHANLLGADGRAHNDAALMPRVGRLFGSFKLDPAGPTEFGLDKPMAPGIAAQLLDPFLNRSLSSPPQKRSP